LRGPANRSQSQRQPGRLGFQQDRRKQRRQKKTTEGKKRQKKKTEEDRRRQKKTEEDRRRQKKTEGCFVRRIAMSLIVAFFERVQNDRKNPL
jgi:hypothetical protein